MDSRKTHTPALRPAGQILPRRPGRTRDWPLTIAVALILGMQIVLTVAVVRLGRLVEMLVDVVTR